MKHLVRKLRFLDFRNSIVNILTTTLNIFKSNAKTLHNKMFVMLFLPYAFSLCGTISFQGDYFLVFHRLSVVSNNIEGEGLVALSQSMKTNPTFSNIYIWGNKFDEATCVVSFFLH